MDPYTNSLIQSLVDTRSLIRLHPEKTTLHFKLCILHCRGADIPFKDFTYDSLTGRLYFPSLDDYLQRNEEALVTYDFISKNPLSSTLQAHVNVLPILQKYKPALFNPREWFYILALVSFKHTIPEDNTYYYQKDSLLPFALQALHETERRYTMTINELITLISQRIQELATQEMECNDRLSTLNPYSHEHKATSHLYNSCLNRRNELESLMDIILPTEEGDADA